MIIIMITIRSVNVYLLQRFILMLTDSRPFLFLNGPNLLITMRIRIFCTYERLTHLYLANQVVHRSGWSRPSLFAVAS